MSETDRSQEVRCPICGEGVLVDVSYEAGGEPRIEAESVEVLAFSCGHETRGPRLATSDQERLSVERRTSEETAETVEPD
jgi:formylmethanofuran dehydrogenase subunit E